MARSVKRLEGQIPWGRATEYTSPTGKQTILYNIATLGDRIGRTPQTIRKWEISGRIPPTPFKNNRGMRLYSKEHIDAIAYCVERYKISIGVPFSQECTRALYKKFKELNDYFFKVDENSTENTEVEVDAAEHEEG